MPMELDEGEWKFLVEYFSSDSFKEMSERNKINKARQETRHICGRKSFQAVSFTAKDTNIGKEPNFQKLWEMTHMKNGNWVDDASAKLNDKVKEFVDEKIQEIEEGADVDPIVNAAFVKVVGKKSGYCRGQGSGVKPSSRKSMNKIQEQLQAQQKERENVESKLMKVQNELKEERKNREVMEARLVGEKKLLKDGIAALVSHMQSGQTTLPALPAAISNIITTSSNSEEASPTVMDDLMD